MIKKFLFRKAQKSDDDIGRNTNKNTIDKKQIQGSVKKSNCPLANPYPAVHKGGINAVAMATPGMALLFSVRDAATIPAKPPKNAINTSKTVGDVLDNISDCASVNGDNLKYSAEVRMEITAAKTKFFNDLKSTLNH